jgi:hypothetical protein
MTKEICEELSAGLLGDTLGFLSKNVAMMNFDGEPPPTNPLRCFNFNKPYATQSGGYVYFPTVEDASVINGFLTASYLPWAENSGYYIILEPDSGPDLLFTATLDGCAVGYVRAKDGAVRVSHHNIQGPSGTDGAAQVRSLSFASGTLQKSDYYGKEEPKNEGEYYVKKESVGVIYGVRKSGVWRMYAQVIARTGKTNLNDGSFLLNVVIRAAREF